MHVVRGAVTAVVMLAATSAATSFATAAWAEPVPALSQAVTAARGQCGPLSYDPVVEQAAQMINHSTLVYVNHTADNVPIDETHPTALTADLGIVGTKVYSLKGSGRSAVDAIRGLLIEGYNVLPDCSYSSFGTSMLYEETSGFHLATVVLVGP